MTATILRSHPGRFLLSLLVLVVSTHLAAGQSIPWRADYNAARREAAETGRPIFIDFVTDHCFYCVKLENSTFRDPEILKLLTDAYIPLKMDANRETVLVEKLRLKAYPTMIMAGPDGKILGMIEGYMEADRLKEHLQRVLQSATTPDLMARDFQEASRAYAAGDFPRALSMLKGIVEDGKNRPVQVKARKLIDEMEQQAEALIVRARQAGDRGQSVAAFDLLSEVLRKFPGTQAATKASDHMLALGDNADLQQVRRVRRARELLAQAREDFRTRDYLACIEKCEVLQSTYEDLPEARDAEALRVEVQANPAHLTMACNRLRDKLGAMQLALADAYLNQGKKEEAMLCLQKVLQESPGSETASSAQMQLARLQGKVTQQTDFKKP